MSTAATNGFQDNSRLGVQGCVKSAYRVRSNSNRGSADSIATCQGTDNPLSSLGTPNAPWTDLLPRDASIAEASRLDAPKYFRDGKTMILIAADAKCEWLLSAPVRPKGNYEVGVRSPAPQGTIG